MYVITASLLSVLAIAATTTAAIECHNSATYDNGTYRVPDSVVLCRPGVTFCFKEVVTGRDFDGRGRNTITKGCATRYCVEDGPYLYEDVDDPRTGNILSRKAYCCSDRDRCNSATVTMLSLAAIAASLVVSLVFKLQ